MASWEAALKRPRRWGGEKTNQCALLPVLRTLLPALNPTVVIINRGYLMRKQLSTDWLGDLNASLLDGGKRFTVWKTLSGNDGGPTARGYSNFIRRSIARGSSEAALVQPFFTRVFDATALNANISARTDLWDSEHSVPLYCNQSARGQEGECTGLHLTSAPNNLLNRRLLQELYPTN